jgi:hypothetical protein
MRQRQSGDLEEVRDQERLASMKAYKIVLLFIDYDNVGLDQAALLIENARLPNHISPGTVMSIEERDIGGWHDGHPLNQLDMQATAFDEMFETQE